jgi:glycyl-tRNA synthetase
MSIDKELRQEIEKIASFCNKIGLVFPAGDIYGGLAGFWDFGPTGTELCLRIKNAWWTDYVRKREDIVGLDGSIITHPMIWKASGHVDGFTDPLVVCLGKCKKNFRADHLVEDKLNKPADGLTLDELAVIIKDNRLKCPECGGDLTDPKVFNLMFKTKVGPVEPSIESYLRPETAQSIFAAIKSVTDSTRIKIPFGIAQIGKVFRNEISPRNFLFRVREFELMEFEYFVDPDKRNECDYSEFADISLNIFHQEHQSRESPPNFETFTLKEAIEKKIFKNIWQAYWIANFVNWFLQFNIKPENLRIRQHIETELSHYAEDTWDIEYKYPFGWKELLGCANRTQYDVGKHQEFSKKKLEYYDQPNNKRFIPYVAAEPSVGVGRIFLTILFEHYTEEEVKGRKRVVLKLPNRLAPIDVAVFPLQKDDKLLSMSESIYKDLKKEDLIVNYDSTGNIGKRYRRMDEIGCPICVTIDFDSLENNTVTLRDRDSMEQIRISVTELKQFILKNKRENLFKKDFLVGSG